MYNDEGDYDNNDDGDDLKKKTEEQVRGKPGGCGRNNVSDHFEAGDVAQVRRIRNSSVSWALNSRTMTSSLSNVFIRQTFNETVAQWKEIISG